jgi:hypothetical protein
VGSEVGFEMGVIDVKEGKEEGDGEREGIGSMESGLNVSTPTTRIPARTMASAAEGVRWGCVLYVS